MGVRAAGPVVVGVDSGVGLVGEVAGVRSRVGRAVGTRGGASGAVGARSGAGRAEARGLLSC